MVPSDCLTPTMTISLTRYTSQIIRHRSLHQKSGVSIMKDGAQANTVTLDNCSHHHAEMNVIKAAEEKLGTYDLSPFHLKLYSTSEPCLMCMGGIMWSGIKELYYGVPTESVEEITGFDEGYKPGWREEFRKRGIIVYGNIERELGEQVLRNYVAKGKTIYKPARQDEQ